MGLKPDQHTAVLIQERVREALHGRGLSAPERAALEDFDRDLERYLR